MEFRVSSSVLNAYLHCPAAYYYEHCLGLHPQPSMPMLKGHIVHEIIEGLPKKLTWSAIKDVVDTDQPSETALKERLQDISADIIFDWYTQEELVEFCKEFCDHPKEQSFKEMMAEVNWNIDGWHWSYVREFFTHIRNKVSPYQARKYVTPTETEIEIILDTDLFITREGDGNLVDNHTIPVKFKGYIDAAIILNDGSEVIMSNTTGLIDYKTSKIFKLPIDDEYINQLYFYAMLWNLKFNIMPDYGMVQYLKSLKSTVVMIPENVEQIMMKKVHYFVNGIQTRHYPGNPSYQFCSKKWCDWWVQCNADGRYSGDRIKGDCDPDWNR